MISLITYYIKSFIFILAAPFYFHFGQYAFVGDFVQFLFDLTDVLGLYYLQFMILGGVVYYRNTIFKSLSSWILRNYSLKNNNVIFLNLFQSFWVGVKKMHRSIKNFFIR